MGSALLCVPGTNCEWPIIPSNQMVEATQHLSEDDQINKLCISTQWKVINLKKEGNPHTSYNMANLGDIMLSEVSQSQKERNCMISLI